MHVYVYISCLETSTLPLRHLRGINTQYLAPIYTCIIHKCIWWVMECKIVYSTASIYVHLYALDCIVYYVYKHIVNLSIYVS